MGMLKLLSPLFILTKKTMISKSRVSYYKPGHGRKYQLRLLKAFLHSSSHTEVK